MVKYKINGIPAYKRIVPYRYDHSSLVIDIYKIDAEKVNSSVTFCLATTHILNISKR
ncbi:hypothetical protein GCM10007384_14880 [Aquimarina muelleri]|uniref:Uncharacterized protein n=1 Tax=Aquimarina muelleri TaxID=279356 RepID=A0A918JVE3_9FLAO|nr:hypothetical protein GCM10007384_14880 [Aquimarina muelleri]